jgi:hypothetical protein
MRLIQTALASAWRSSLVDADRAGWTAIAGPTESGIDAYIKGNAQRLLGGDAQIPTAPDSLALAASPAVAPVVDASAHSITFAAIGSDPDISGNVFVSRPQASSRLSRQFGFTFAGRFADVSTGGTVTLGVTHPAYNLVAGDIVYVRLVQYAAAAATNAGAVAPDQEFRCIVVA